MAEMIKILISGLLVFMIVTAFLPQLFAQEIDDSSFFPLGLCYRWEYGNIWFPHSEIIIDTIRINERLYFGVSKHSGHVVYWFREDNNKAYLLNMEENLDVMLFDFNANTGESWELPSGYECSFGTLIILASKEDTIITPADTFYNCYHFEHEPICFDAGIYHTWFAEGVGKVRYVADNIAGRMEYNLNRYTFVYCPPGDVNGNGSVDIEDVLAIVDHMLRINLLGEDPLIRADYNGDGQINVLDIVGIVKKILGMFNDLYGTWVHAGYVESMTILRKAEELDANEYGFIIYPDGRFTERKNAGWCATPPITYANYEGEWTKLSENLLEIIVGYWGGTTSYQMEIISLSSDELRILYHYDGLSNH